jgi:uncharacterized protein YbaA (DUF1428 family)
MAKYIDGFVLVVPKGKEANYEKMANMGRDAWMKQKSRPYTEMTGATSDENVWFSFIIFNSKEDRDEINKKVMAEMSETFKDQADFEMPTDMTKMAYGGFEVAVEG